MKNIVLILLVCFLFQPTQAFSGTERSSAAAIQWWLEGKNKFDGADIRTVREAGETEEIRKQRLAGG